MFFDELDLGDNTEDGVELYDDIGDILKNKKEAEKLYETAKIFRPYWHHHYTNSQYLKSPELPKLREASLEAFKVFIENEKDNKEFCQFIVDILKKERDWFKINQEEQDPYQIILDYIRECDKVLQEKNESQNKISKQ